MAKRRYWVYFTFASNSTPATFTDAFATWSLDGEQDVDGTSRTLLRTRVQGQILAQRSGFYTTPPGYIQAGQGFDPSNPFFMCHVWADGEAGNNPNPAPLSTQNPDWMPHVGVSDVAPVIVTGLEVGGALYVPAETAVPVTSIPVAYDAWHIPANSQNSESRRRADPGHSLMSRLDFYQPVATNMTDSLSGIAYATVAQLVEAVDV